MNIVTRFAPSPTGLLHIGGARTALFNYLFAKHHNGKFLLRIEDTDINRSSKENVDAILKSLEWLDLKWDGEIIYQSDRIERYKQVAKQLVEIGLAYYCFEPKVDEVKQDARNYTPFKSKWRDIDQSTHPTDQNPVIRFKAPIDGVTVIHDVVQGDVVIENKELEDIILLRADGIATYMLACVVDDHDMGITHIIRGDDHLNNTAKQILIYNALNYTIPVMAHMSLMHGQDGAKLSKRHGALGVDAYKEMGYLPDALCNYLLRLGWSHNNDEIISRDQAITWFSLNQIGRSPAKVDFDKMRYINGWYIKNMDNSQLMQIIQDHININSEEFNAIERVMDSIKARVDLIPELIELAKIYTINYSINLSLDHQKIITNSIKYIKELIFLLNDTRKFDKHTIKNTFKEVADCHNIKLHAIIMPIRLLMTGMESSLGIFEMLEIFGKKRFIQRVNKTAASFNLILE
ncbi:MAG: glutamate--tRNA ligase [Rickettsiaceae bacterium]